MCQIFRGLFEHETIHEHHIGLLEHCGGTGGWLKGVGVRTFRNKPHDVGPDVTHHLSNKAGDGGNGGHDAWCPTLNRGANGTVLIAVFALSGTIKSTLAGTASQQSH